jgi:antibiotic biosynthesis monooxygenase (ABM) superfamily enzyme
MPDPMQEKPMTVTVFRSRHMPDVQEEYAQWAKRMGELAAAVAGYISHKGFVADDGERLTLAEVCQVIRETKFKRDRDT